MAPPTRSAAMNPWRSPINTLLFRLKFLLQPAIKGTAGPELLREDPEARPITDDVLLIPHVEDVEPRLHLADPRQGEWLRDPDVGGLVRLDRRVVRVDDGASQPTAGKKVEAGHRSERHPAIRGPRGGGNELIVVGVDVVVLNEGEVVLAEQGLRGFDACGDLS